MIYSEEMCDQHLPCFLLQLRYQMLHYSVVDQMQVFYIKRWKRKGMGKPKKFKIATNSFAAYAFTLTKYNLTDKDQAYWFL